MGTEAWGGGVAMGIQSRAGGWCRMSLGSGEENAKDRLLSGLRNPAEARSPSPPAPF